MNEKIKLVVKEPTKIDILWKLWEDFGDIPIDKNECIDVEWHGFGKGTPKMDIWHWFDDKSKGKIPPR